MESLKSTGSMGGERADPTGHSTSVADQPKPRVSPSPDRERRERAEKFAMAAEKYKKLKMYEEYKLLLTLDGFETTRSM